MKYRFKSVCALAGIATCLAAYAAEAAEPDTAGFLAACVEDPVVVEEPGLEPGGKSTPEIYCQCIAGKFVEHKIPQADVDLITKLHNEELTDEEASNPRLDDVLSDNEIIEDECKVSLGLPFPADNGGGMMPKDDVTPLEDEESLGEDSED